MPKPPFIHRVKLRNYKSIAWCDVALGPLVILVGPNGSGKSNFSDALSLTCDALWVPLEKALWERGGLSEVLRRSAERPNKFSITLHFDLPNRTGQGLYSFEVMAHANGAFTVSREVCEIEFPDGKGKPARYEVREGKIVDTSIKVRMPRPMRDRLFLVSASNVEEFWPVYDALTDMKFYKFDLDVIRRPQSPESDDFLHTPNGHNLAGVLGTLEQSDPQNFERIQGYMRSVMPGVERVSRVQIPIVNLEAIQFLQQIIDMLNPLQFTAINMSDGTLRALAVVTALLQGSDYPPSLIGLEEPELALHPAAAGVLWDAIMDAQDRAQVIITTHSADLLDRKDVPTDAILAADSDAGKTQIGPIVESSRNLLQERLATPGELLRQSMLSPNEQITYPQSYVRFDL